MGELEPFVHLSHLLILESSLKDIVDILGNCFLEQISILKNTVNN